MNVLGINCFSHDTSACLIMDGEVVAFAEEERFNREKHTKAFPDLAIDFCLKQGRIGIDDVSYVGFSFRPGLDLKRGFFDFLIRFPASFPRFVGQIKFDARLIRKVNDFKKRYKYKGKIVYVGHHEAHVASGFFASSFDRAAILSIDRGGDYLSTLLALGEGNKLKFLKAIKNPHSLGSLYTVVTNYLGFKPNNGEGKVMGLAPYGRPTYYEDFRRLVRTKPDGGFSINLGYFTYQNRGGYGVSKRFEKLFGPPRLPEGRMEERHEDIAWALQKVTEDTALHVANYLYELTRENNLCIVGGVGLNSVMNEAILRKTPFKDVFIQPAANDAGTALGAALYIWHVFLENGRDYVMRNAYLGPDFSQEEIEESLKKQKLAFKRLDNPARKAAELIAEGKILGWFQGRMEAGPRALGNRSILADPRCPDMKDILNKKVKHREGFRPFAPSVLEEDAARYFDNYYPSPFMLLVLPLRKEKQDQVPAICHVDGTGRLQTVSQEDNPLYWELINEFKKLTGVPLILNTSFNIRGQPIVMSPEDATDCYLSTGLDCLIIGRYLLEK